jgi:glycosyltransferase involved in cell wall biosynthesis
MTLVSIITPSYNQAAFLEETIQSVLGQDYRPLEYIVVDGGSTDGSVPIIEQYAGQLAWWVSEPDAGQADAINKGMRRAQGELVAWLNSDDLYLPGAVAQAVDVFQAHPRLGMIFGDAVTIDPQGQRLNQLTFPDLGLDDLMGFRIICQPAVFMRRAVLEQVNYLDPSYHYMLDHHLWLRMAQAASIQHVPQVWAAARYHPGAKNVSQAESFSRETLCLLEWMQTQPHLRLHLAARRKRVEAGAYRLSARYLLDGGQPAAALRFYARSLVRSPGFALQHWRRMLYAVVSLMGGKPFMDKMRGQRS